MSDAVPVFIPKSRIVFDTDSMDPETGTIDLKGFNAIGLTSINRLFEDGTTLVSFNLSEFIKPMCGINITDGSRVFPESIIDYIYSDDEIYLPKCTSLNGLFAEMKGSSVQVDVAIDALLCSDFANLFNKTKGITFGKTEGKKLTDWIFPDGVRCYGMFQDSTISYLDFGKKKKIKPSSAQNMFHGTEINQETLDLSMLDFSMINDVNGLDDFLYGIKGSVRKIILPETNIPSGIFAGSFAKDITTNITDYSFLGTLSGTFSSFGSDLFTSNKSITRVDIGGLIYTNSSATRGITDWENLSNNCEIIVNNQDMKKWILEKNPNLSNIRTRN